MKKISFITTLLALAINTLISTNSKIDIMLMYGNFEKVRDNQAATKGKFFYKK